MTILQRAGAARRRLVLLCGLIPLLTAAVLALYRPISLARLDDAVYDTLFRWARTSEPSGRVVIVDVDERSLSTIGQWPWRRDVIGNVIARLREMGASTIALDIIFAERDRFAPGRPESLSKVRSQTTPDEVLGRTLRGGRVVLGYAMTFDRAAHAPTACVLHSMSLASLQSRDHIGDLPYFRATGAVCSLPILAQAAGASGFLNAAPDSDGILRRVPLLVELDHRVYPSLALAAVAASTGAHGLTLRIWNVNASSLMVGSQTVPVDGKGNVLLRYRGKKRTLPYVSAADVLSGQAPAGLVKDKIVFVGTTALGTREVVATPLDTLFAGVEVQATVADNLLRQDFISRSPHGAILESLAVIVPGIAVAMLLTATGLASGVCGGTAAIVTLWCAAAWLFSTRGVFVSPLFPTIGMTSALAVMTLAKFTVERRRAERAGRDKTTAQRFMVQTLLSLTEARDAETGKHSRRTQQYARLLAEQLSRQPEFHDDLTPETIDLLASLAPLHDIGKVAIPDHILNKPGELTPDELAEMRKHPSFGRDVILKAEQQVGVRDDAILAMAKDIVYTHHERWDGAGYPRGLRGAEIPVAGRVMALVDVYDAASTRRLYRPSLSHDEVVALIVHGRGAHFDPAVVDAFVSVAPHFKRVSQETDH